MYWLELAGEADAFAAREAATAAAPVELLAPGIASAGSVAGDASPAPSTSPASPTPPTSPTPPASPTSPTPPATAGSGGRAGGIGRLAYTRAAHEAVGRTDAQVDAAVALLSAAGIDREGTVAVRARNVRNTADVSTSEAERELGSVLVDRGFAVDLDDPDHVLRALFAEGPRAEHDAVAGADGGDASVCALGWVAAEAARDFAPKPTDRPFFQPGSMAPADARAYANLAGAAPGRTLLDPMCGTGGLPLEAGLVGSDVVACDAQRKMVRGTRENLREYVGESGSRDGDSHGDPGGDPDGDSHGDPGGDSHGDRDRDPPGWHVVRGDATALALDDDAVDGVAFDAPYGRQSKVARHELADLVAGALAEAARVAPRAVLVADRDWRGPAREAGWTVDAAFERRVHRSLTRHVLVLDRE